MPKQRRNGGSVLSAELLDGMSLVASGIKKGGKTSTPSTSFRSMTSVQLLKI